MNRIISPTAVAGLLLLATPPPLAAQTANGRDSKPQPSCEVPAGPGGLVRGDRVPRGCVLRGEGPRGVDSSREQDWSTPLGPCEQHSERISYTPNPKRSALANAARVCGNLFERAAGGGLSSVGFGPVDRHFEPIDRRFEPIDRHFEPIDRRFEPLERPFGPLNGSFGSRSSEQPARDAHPTEASRASLAKDARRRGG